jgi:hypothetical protein
MSATATAMHAPHRAEKISELPDKAVDLASKLGKANDRTMFALLLIIGIVVLGTILHWHRQDQQAMTVLFRDVLRQNTEALVRVSVALDRLERGK